MQKLDVQMYDRRLKRAFTALESANISSASKKNIREFTDYCFLQGMSKARIDRYLQVLPLLSRLLEKNFKTAKKKDIMSLIRKLESTQHYSDWTKYTYKVCLKRFYKWLLGDDKDYPDCVSWIKPKIKNGNKLPEELLTEEDVKSLINSADNARDKAFISALYESGCRVSELGNSRIKHVTFDEYGSVLIVDGKTGMRRIRLISSSPDLAEYLNVHPLKEDKDAPLWIGHGTRNKDKQLEYGAITAMLRKVAGRAGIKKRVNPHNFRHSRATHLAKHLTEAQMKEYFGWVQGSNMASVYVHLSGRDVDKAILKVYGIKTNDDEQEENKLKPINCNRCEFTNSATNKFCSRCGLPLDLATALDLDKERSKADELMNELVKDPEVMALLKEKIKESKL